MVPTDCAIKVRETDLFSDQVGNVSYTVGRRCSSTICGSSGHDLSQARTELGLSETWVSPLLPPRQPLETYPGG